MQASFRLGGALVLLIAAAAVTYRLTTRELGEASARPAFATVVEEARVQPSNALTEPTSERSAQRDEVADAVEAPDVVPADSSVETTQPTLKLRGRVIVTDRDGSVRDDHDGEFALVVWQGDIGRHERVWFKAGEWTASIAVEQPIEGLSADELFAGELAAVVDDPSERVDVPASGELTIRAHVPPAVVLRVVDVATGADLHGVSLVRADSFSDEAAGHPGFEFTERRVATGLASPVDVNRHAAALGRWGEQRVLVGAPGYAWSLVEFDFANGGERTVALERAAELSILVRGVDPQAGERLRLRSAVVTRPLLDLALTADGAIEVDALAPGEVRVSAEIGPWINGPPLVVGEGTVVLRAGERGSLALDLAPAPKLVSASAAGIVFIAESWEGVQPLGNLELIGTPLGGREGRKRVALRRTTSSRDGYDAFHWACTDVQVGRHEFEVDEPRFSVVLDVPPGGRDDFELVLHGPAELLVLVVDDATGEPILEQTVNWRPRRPEAATWRGFENSRYDAERGRHVIRTVPTVVELMLWTSEHLPYNDEVDLTRGVREHTIRLQRASSIEVKARSGDTRLTIPDGWDDSPSESAGGGETRLISDSRWDRTFVVSKPGVYELTPPRIPGYRELPVQRIEVFAGRKTEHVLEYEPERP